MYCPSYLTTRPLIILFLSLFVACSSPPQAEKQSLKTTTAPSIQDIVFKDIKNQKHDLAQYRGKWLFLNFWASYCPICKQEIPDLIRFQDKNKQNVIVLGINYAGETEQQIRAAMKHYGFNYSIVPKQVSITKHFANVTGVPTTIVISPQGKMVARAVGRQTYAELNAYLAVR